MPKTGLGGSCLPPACLGHFDKEPVNGGHVKIGHLLLAWLFLAFNDTRWPNASGWRLVVLTPLTCQWTETTIAPTKASSIIQAAVHHQSSVFTLIVINSELGGFD